MVILSKRWLPPVPTFFGSVCILLSQGRLAAPGSNRGARKQLGLRISLRCHKACPHVGKNFLLKAKLCIDTKAAICRRGGTPIVDAQAALEEGGLLFGGQIDRKDAGTIVRKHYGNGADRGLLPINGVEEGEIVLA